MNSRLNGKQRRFLILLGLPAFGLALCSATVSTYLPVLINELSGPVVSGSLIAVEGLFALFIPTLVGLCSDRLRTRMGGRMPFVLAGAGLATFSLIFMPISVALFESPLIWLAIGLALFFIAYFVYYSPYYALFPDLVSHDMRGRSVGAQGTFREVGLLVALVGGGFLLQLWQPLPFLVSAAAIAGVTVFFFVRMLSRIGGEEGASKASRPTPLGANWSLVRENRDIRLWVIANSLWEASIGALKTFVVLYFTIGVGFSQTEMVGSLALVALMAVIAAPLSGTLADRFGHRPVMMTAVVGFGVGLLPTLFTKNPYFLVGIVPVAFAAVVLITLPYSVLMGLLPDGHHGVAAGLFGFSHGVGTLIGPLAAGIAIQLLAPANLFVFGETQGYVAMFPVASAFLLLSIPLLYRMRI